MLTLITALALVVPQEKAADPSKELGALCKKASAVTNFSFSIDQQEEGGFGGGGPSPKMAGRYKKGSPVEIKRGEQAYYRDGDTLIHSVGEDEWEVFDMEAGFGGGGDREQMRALFSMMSVPLPHKVLAEISGMVADAARAEKDGKVVYSGKLNEKGAEAYSGAQRMRDMASRFGGGDPEMDVSGSYEVIATAKGVIESIVLKTEMSADFGGRAMDRARTTTVSFSKPGKTELVVPKGVLACLEL